MSTILIEFWWSRGPDLNRGPADLQNRADGALHSLIDVRRAWQHYKEDYAAWLQASHDERTYKSYLSNLERFFAAHPHVTTGNIRTLLEREYTRHKAVALRTFVRYLYETGKIGLEDYERLKRNIPLYSGGVDTHFYSEDDIRKIYEYFSTRKSVKYQLLFLTALFSGLRRNHVIEFLNKFDPSTEVNISSGCVRYPLFVKKGNKAAYWVYLPKWLSDELKKHKDELRLNTMTLEKKVKDKLRFRSIRKFFFTTAIEIGVPDGVIDFIQGRSARSIGAKHYLDKTRIADKYYPRIAEKLEKILEVRK
ncbi:integrase [Thermococcus sp. LS2]|uniref:integrase n=1 Tax=Thermococcus sp. LS2 TaxID=1638260 RepID=UPI00143A16D1|nr:integrase [Thermococcus sp. LS2]